MNRYTLLIIIIASVASYFIGSSIATTKEEAKYKNAYDVQLIPKGKGTIDSHVGFLIYNKASYQYNGLYNCTSSGTMISCLEAPNKILTPTSLPTPVTSYRGTFMKICTEGEIYCTCLYNVLHQNYSDAEIANHLNGDFINVFRGTDPMFVYALDSCNNTFNSK